MVILDTEVYKDYFLLCVLELDTGKTRRFEMYEGKEFDVETVTKLMQKYTTVSFNGINFDLPILVAALHGCSCAQLKAICDEIIVSRVPGWQIYDRHSLNRPAWDHIDIIEVAPGSGSLKIYGGRLHTPTLQDLPITPESSITPEMRQQLCDYCINDLAMTANLYEQLKPAIDLRIEISKEYGIDLRSKSDAQIAETIIKYELNKRTAKNYRAPNLEENFNFKYKNPKIISFQTEQLKAVYARVKSETFTLGGSGSVVLPESLRKERIKIGTTEYRMGIGGLHSCEKAQYVVAGEDEILCDQDVLSYYPNIILQQKLAPESLGKPFLDVYQTLVLERVFAKKKASELRYRISILERKLENATT